MDELVTTTDDEVNDELEQQFYTAAMADSTSTGNTALDTLLHKGLYGKQMPHILRKKRAAEAFQQAFDLVGGIPRLALWADKNPSAFFALYSKLIPATVTAEVNATIKIEAPWMNPNRLSYKDKTDVTDVTPKLES